MFERRLTVLTNTIEAQKKQKSKKFKSSHQLADFLFIGTGPPMKTLIRTLQL